MHVGAHQGAVGIIMLQEGDQRGADAHHLVGGYIDVVDVFVVVNGEYAVETAGIAAFKLAVLIQRSGRLGDDEFVFSIG